MLNLQNKTNDLLIWTFVRDQVTLAYNNNMFRRLRLTSTKKLEVINNHVSYGNIQSLSNRTVDGCCLYTPDNYTGFNWFRGVFYHYMQFIRQFLGVEINFFILKSVILPTEWDNFQLHSSKNSKSSIKKIVTSKVELFEP